MNGINLSHRKAICYHLHRMSMCSTWKAANDESGVRHSNKLLKNKSGKLISFFTTFQHYQQTWQLAHFNEPYSQNYLGQCWSTIRSLSNAADLFCERNFFSISVIHFVAASTKHRIHHLQNQKRKNGKDWESVCVCACT